MEAPTPPSPTELDAAERIILLWDSTASEEARERMIFEGHRDEVDRYLQAVDEIQRSMSSASLVSVDDQTKLNSAIQIAMARLEDEFRNILLNHTSPIEPDSLTCRRVWAAPPRSASRRDGRDHPRWRRRSPPRHPFNRGCCSFVREVQA
ncbi:hypothetical protein PRUPE_2G175900 [Prunus persica]|uniref:Uncharacterized protein n=1 Tax=Prunus persica TaxID=3760 RepID=A0A251QIH6_PRUPE|nr:hypothetical protein PRUPE_2G175900 [Prunus persica]